MAQHSSPIKIVRNNDKKKSQELRLAVEFTPNLNLSQYISSEGDLLITTTASYTSLEIRFGAGRPVCPSERKPDLVRPVQNCQCSPETELRQFRAVQSTVAQQREMLDGYCSQGKNQSFISTVQPNVFTLLK